MELTNFSYGEGKRLSILKQFGASPYTEDLQKGINAGARLGLTLKEITTKDGTKAHRWVNDKDEEYAERGAKVNFQHNGQKVSGEVGRVSKSSGKYVVKDDKGNEYKKHPHEIQHHGANAGDIDGDSDKTKAKSDFHNYAAARTDQELEDYIKRDDVDPAAKKAAQDTLRQRKGSQGQDDGSGGKDGKPKKQADTKQPDASKQPDKGDDKGAPKTGNAKVDKIEAKKVKDKADMEAESDEQEGEDVNQRFEDFSHYVTGVVQGYKKAAIMYGSGGVGKTWTTVQTLKGLGLTFFDEDAGHQIGDDNYDVATFEGGKVTPTAFYRAMWEHNGKVILFDDCDAALQHPDIKGYLKGALGSNQSTVTNATAGNLKDSAGNAIPKQFKFTGKMIFISNLPKKFMFGQEMQPIMSRSFSTDMTMDRKQTMDRIKHIATDPQTGKLTNMKFDGHPNYSHEDMESVINMMDKYKDKAFDINARTAETLMGMKKLSDQFHGSDPAKATKDFERKARLYFKQGHDGGSLQKAVTTDFNETLALRKLGFDVVENLLTC